MQFHFTGFFDTKRNQINVLINSRFSHSQIHVFWCWQCSKIWLQHYSCLFRFLHALPSPFGGPPLFNSFPPPGGGPRPPGQGLPPRLWHQHWLWRCHQHCQGGLFYINTAKVLMGFISYFLRYYNAAKVGFSYLLVPPSDVLYDVRKFFLSVPPDVRKY